MNRDCHITTEPTQSGIDEIRAFLKEPEVLFAKAFDGRLCKELYDD